MNIRNDRSWDSFQPDTDPLQHDGGRLAPEKPHGIEDVLDPPPGLEIRDIRRSLDFEDLQNDAPDMQLELLRRIAGVREQIREETYVTEPKLRKALERFFRSLDDPS